MDGFCGVISGPPKLCPQSSSVPKVILTVVRSKSLVEEFSIKIYHPYMLIIILQQRPANNGVGGAVILGITLNYLMRVQSYAANLKLWRCY